MSKIDEWFQEALSSHQRGDLANAKVLYKKVLEREKEHVDANSLLGTLHVQQGQIEVGIEFLNRALAIQPSHSVAHANLGFAYHEKGELELAVRHYRAAVESDSSTIEAQNNLGCALREMGHLAEAAKVIDTAVRNAPNYAPGWYNLGLIRLQEDAYDVAIACFKKAIELEPRYYEAHYSLGNAYRERGSFDQACDAYNGALLLKPDSVEAHTNLGVVLAKQGDKGRAREHYTKAVELKPTLADVHNNLGALEFEEGRFEAAAARFQKAVELQPGHVDALANLGNALQWAGRYEEAIECCDRALVLDPRSRNAHLNKGVALSKVQREDEAIKELLFCLELDPSDVDALTNLGGIYQLIDNYESARHYLERAVATNPNNALAHWNLGIALAASGDLACAWREYEWGIHTNERALSQRYEFPRWQGQPLGSGALVVYPEQGLGDEVLFASCLPDLVLRTGSTGRIVVQCDPRLETLFRRSFPQIIVHGGKRDEDPAWLKAYEPIGYQIPLGSLPLHLRNSLADFPRENAFLKADAQQQQAWAERLTAFGPGLKVGIAWRSGLRTRMRSLGYTRLEDWLPVFAVEGVTWINLQYGDCREELEEANRRFGMSIHCFDDLDLFNDLDGSAALIAALDLVISVGTSTYNFAGGLGVPTFLLNPPGRSWAYCGTDGVPWYPSVTLFMQEKRGDWLPVMERAAAALRTRVKAMQSSPVACPEIAAALFAHQHSELDTAAELYGGVLTEIPDNAQALALLNTLRVHQGKADEAQRLPHRAHESLPQSTEILTNLGFVGRRREDEEMAYYDAALVADPAFLPAYKNLTDVLLENGAYERAAGVLEQWLLHDPRSVEAYYRLGMARLKCGDGEAARRAWLRTLELDPIHARVHNELGFLNYGAGKLVQAEQYYRTALRLDPDFKEAHVNLGSVLTRKGCYQEAIEHYDVTLAREPDYAPAHYNRGVALLALGQLQEGWQEWAWRLRVNTGSAFSRSLDVAPLWQGEPLSGKTLLVHGEQDVGDELLFGTCLADVISRGAQVILQCDPRLEPLFKRSFPNISVRGSVRNEQPSWIKGIQRIDYQCPSGALPVWMRTNLSDFRTQLGYLEASSHLRTIWRERLRKVGGKFKIGITWRGHPHETLSVPSNIQLVEWAGLFSVPGITFINLQHGLETAEREELAGRVICFDDLDLFNDFENTAALMSELDLVISVETVSYNLAGSLSVPTWLVSAQVPERGWVMLGTEKIPWYPSVRVFRQQRLGEWAGVFRQLTGALIEEMRSRSAVTIDVTQWASFLAPLVKVGAVVSVIGSMEPELVGALQGVVGSRGQVQICSVGQEFVHAQAAIDQCDLLALGRDADAVMTLLEFAPLIERCKPLILSYSIPDNVAGALRSLGYGTVPLATLLRRETAPALWCAFPMLAHSRQNPSAKYRELLSYYRNMHCQGYTRIVNGEAVYTTAANTFPGNELPNFVRPIRAMIRSTQARTLLDYGAGKGMQYRWPIDVDGLHFESVQQYWGIDHIAIYEPALLGNDQLPVQPLDGVVCTDVLEHIPESDVPWVVSEMFSLAEKFVFASVACYPALARLPNGENAHCTVRTAQWWNGLLQLIASRYPRVYYLVAAEEASPASMDSTVHWISNFALPDAD